MCKFDYKFLRAKNIMLYNFMKTGSLFIFISNV